MQQKVFLELNGVNVCQKGSKESEMIFTNILVVLANFLISNDWLLEKVTVSLTIGLID